MQIFITFLEAHMIFVTKAVPLIALEKDILESMVTYLPQGNDHAIVLIPLVRPGAPTISRRCLQPDAYRIALEYQGIDVNPISQILLTGNLIKGFDSLPASVRIPYTLFVCCDTLYRTHHNPLRCGSTAHALIQRFAS